MARRDGEAFTAFVLGCQPALRRTAYLMCGGWSLASGYVQDALIRVYRHWPRLRSEGEARSYARKAVVSVVIDAKRRRSSSELPVETVRDRVGGAGVPGRQRDRAHLQGAVVLRTGPADLASVCTDRQGVRERVPPH